MPRQCRVGDDSRNPTDDHKGDVDDVTGPAVSGSTNVLVNGRRAFRVRDKGLHSKCKGINKWRAVEGSATVTINGEYAVRLDDETLHCGGVGKNHQRQRQC